ncbi:MAG: LapA family protein [Smithellaceae bacterium]|nr:LapA family protein [Smithellaceae bacterium]
MKVFYTIVVGIVVLFIITFSLQNTAGVFLRYYEYVTPEPIPAYMLISMAFLAGVVFTGFMGVVERFRLSRTITKQNKLIKELKKQLRESEKPLIIDDEEKLSGREQGS